MDYFDVYKKRLNRYGNNFQTRIQNQREKDFENYLLKTVYRVDFEYKDEIHPAALERKSQDHTKTIQYLLTRIDLKIPSGTVLTIKNQDGDSQPWMIYWLEEIQASGYNRYIVVKMTHFIRWKSQDGETYSSLVYLHGKGDSAVADALKGSGALYLEDNNKDSIIMPLKTTLEKDDYMVIKVNTDVEGGQSVEQAFRVDGYDYVSTPGVGFVTIDPVPIRDLTPPPSKEEGYSEEDFFWIDFAGGES